MAIIVREMRMVLLEIEDKAEEISEVHSIVEVEDEVVTAMKLVTS